MPKFSTVTLTSFLFYFLQNVPSCSISSTARRFGKTGVKRSRFLNLLWKSEISTVFEVEDISGKSWFLDKPLLKPTWIILRLASRSILEHEGPFTEANASQFMRSLKWFWHAFLMLPIITFSYSNATKFHHPSH